MGATLSHVFHRAPRRAIPPLPPPPPPPEPEKPDISIVGGISKNQQKKLARGKRLQERKKQRKEADRTKRAKKKAEKRAEREAVWSALPDEERERLKQERLKVMQAGRAGEKERRAQIRRVLENHTRYAFCVDLGWNNDMFDKERKSLARQLAYSYNALRKCADSGHTPLAMSITGIDAVIKPVLDFAAQGWQTWPVELSEKGLTEFHDKAKLVYLTHDSEHVLTILDPNVVYVVGGIVDRNRLVGATREKAERLGIKTARLNLDLNVSIKHGTPVLTVNHCAEILIHAANGLSWKDAYLKVLPVRKGINASAVKET